MSSVDTTINQLNQASSLVVLVLALINIIPGGIGLIFNVLVFTRAPLRREPCAVYFFWSTCFSLFMVLIILPVRVVAVTFNMDMATYNIGICKIEYFALYAARSTSSWLIVFACIDRFFHSSTNARLRRISSFKIAKMAIGTITLVLFIVHIHMIVYYQLISGRDRFGNITFFCSGQKGIYSTFLGFWNMVLYSLSPCLLMLFVGLLTLNNLHRHRSVLPVTVETNRITRRTDTQLLRMLTAQVLIIIIATLPLSINQLYSSFTSNVPKDTLRLAQENLATRVVNTTTYFAHSSTFYLYTLSGTVFRKEFLKIIGQCYHLNRNRIVPITVQTHKISVLQRSQQIIPAHITNIQHNNSIIRTTNM